MQVLKPLVFLVWLVSGILSCASEDDLDGKNFDYIIVNTSEIDVGVKTSVNASESGYSLLAEEVTLKPGEERVVLKADEQKDPWVFIQYVEVYDETFAEKYKTLDLSQRTVSGNVTRINVWMPHPTARDIVKHNVGVSIYLDETSIFGYYPRNELTYETYFFSTSDDFETLLKFQMPPATNYYSSVAMFGGTFIASNQDHTSVNTRFFKSDNEGVSWSPILDKINGSDERFMTADFISPEEGWVLTYNHWDSTCVYKINGGSYSKISTLKGYCVLDCRFLDSNKGYAIANTKNSTMPADSPNSYFFRTEDGGMTWSEPIPISSTEWPLKLFVFSSGDLFVMRSNNFEMHRSYYHSADDGQTWQLVDAQTEGYIRDMHFISADIGFIKTGNDALWSRSNSGFLYKTVDGGTTWDKIPSPALLGSKVYFYDEQNGYLQDLLYGEGQVLTVTRDGGMTWKDVLYPYDYLIE